MSQVSVDLYGRYGVSGGDWGSSIGGYFSGSQGLNGGTFHHLGVVLRGFGAETPAKVAEVGATGLALPWLATTGVNFASKIASLFKEAIQPDCNSEKMLDAGLGLAGATLEMVEAVSIAGRALKSLGCREFSFLPEPVGDVLEVFAHGLELKESVEALMDQTDTSSFSSELKSAESFVTWKHVALIIKHAISIVSTLLCLIGAAVGKAFSMTVSSVIVVTSSVAYFMSERAKSSAQLDLLKKLAISKAS